MDPFINGLDSIFRMMSGQFDQNNPSIIIDLNPDEFFKGFEGSGDGEEPPSKSPRDEALKNNRSHVYKRGIPYGYGSNKDSSSSLRDEILQRPHKTPSYMEDYEYADENPDIFQPKFFDPFSSKGFPRNGFFNFGDDHFEDILNNFFDKPLNRPFLNNKVEDENLDNQIKNEGLNSIFNKNQNLRNKRNYFNSFSRSLITRPDGSMEEKTKRIDENGDKEVTIVMRYPDGNQTTKIERHLSDGTIETIEDSDGGDIRSQVMKPHPSKDSADTIEMLAKSCKDFSDKSLFKDSIFPFAIQKENKEIGNKKDEKQFDNNSSNSHYDMRKLIQKFFFGN